ncbi:MAG: hypothetical protein EU539_00160 [Promethearchaeota archaeon]|nr:MAG: hypothetical protein EU539_00160 [Candidatus Lokiarchaeota archaeon]
MEITELMVNIVDDSDRSPDDDFVSEFAKGYLSHEVAKKEQRRNEFFAAYQNMEEKESFNAQYVKSLIDVLDMEIAEDKSNF